MNLIYRVNSFLGRIVLAMVGIVCTATFTYAATDAIADLKKNIAEKNAAIKQIEEEIAQYERELISTSKEAKSLQKTIAELELTQKKLRSDVALTQAKIDATTMTLDELSYNIAATEKEIENVHKGLIKTIQKINELEADTFIEKLLSQRQFSDVWDDIESLNSFRTIFRLKLDELRMLHNDLLAQREKVKQENEQLLQLRAKYIDQKQIVESNKREKGALLSKTKRQEETYKELLEQKKRAKLEFEAQLHEYESRLKFVLDRSKIPQKGTGALSWPLPDLSLDSCYLEGQLAVNCVTQYFGNTKFAQSGAYNGNGHNGVDFRAISGTEVYAAAPGVVVETGNTDAYRGCYSYGKWILIRHDNGLATLYAHLSLIKVKKGERVSTGQVIGYSGNTGYSTGPHLHFTVYAADAVQVVRLGDIKSRTNCADARIPTASYSAYLNPIDFLKD